MVFAAAYQGTPGAYSEMAARQLLGDSPTLLPCAMLDEIFDAVSAGRARHAVVPVENSLSGTVPNAYELLVAHDVQAVGETRVHIDHVLVAPPGVERRAIRRVLSHPVALAQCTRFFGAHKELQAVPVFDTAGAVEIVMRERDGCTAAIAARRAAEIHGGAILAERLQDHEENWTRFLLIVPTPAAGRAASATKAVASFTLPHQPGTLSRVLQAIAARGVNLTKIESRPIHGQPFEYRFFVELRTNDAGSLDDVISAMGTVTTGLRVIGRY